MTPVFFAHFFSSSKYGDEGVCMDELQCLARRGIVMGDCLIQHQDGESMTTEERGIQIPFRREIVGVCCLLDLPCRKRMVDINIVMQLSRVIIDPLGRPPVTNVVRPPVRPL